MSKLVIVKEILTFCETTTLQGIPHAARSSDRVSRYVWIASVLVLMSITAWQFDQVVFSYLKYGTSTTMREVVGNSTFHWLTFRNESPFEEISRSWAEFIYLMEVNKELIQSTPDLFMSIWEYRKRSY